MLRPIKTVTLRKAGSHIDFARKVAQRAAVFGSYDLSDGELVFNVGAAREAEDLTSVLELMDAVLGLLRRGFDRRADRLAAKLINNIDIILRVGGFSRAYSETRQLFVKVLAAYNGEETDLSELRREIRAQRELIRKERLTEVHHGTRGYNGADLSKPNVGRSPKISRGEMVLNSLNSGILRISSRDPELAKMIRGDKVFRELSLSNIQRLRSRSERTLLAERFLNGLTEKQISLLEKLVINEGLFSELREKTDERRDLKFLIENSSEKSLSEFFESLRQRTERVFVSEESFFSSVEDMREFFVGASHTEIERLIARLEKEPVYKSEVRTLTSALRLYDEKRSAFETVTEKRRTAETELSEFETLSEIELRNMVNDAAFSEEYFLNSLNNSKTLKSYFAEYAWENYRFEETLKRYSEYGGRSFEESGAVQRISDGENVAVLAADGDVKNNFAEFLINSGELDLIYTERVRNEFFNSSEDVTAAFAEYLVIAVRENADHFSERVRELAEKAEDILYWQEPELGEKSASVSSLIREVWDGCAPALSEVFSQFTQKERYGELIRLYSTLPKTDRAAVSEMFSAAAQGNALFAERSEALLLRLDGILKLKDHSAENTQYTFYDAVNELSESAFAELKALAEDRAEKSSFAAPEKVEDVELYAEHTAGLIVSSVLAEYMTNEVKNNGTSYSSSIRELAERIETVLHDERFDIGGRAERSIELIYNARTNETSKEISRLLERFSERYSESGKLINEYKRLAGGVAPETAVSESSSLLERIERLTERSDLLNVLAEYKEGARFSAARDDTEDEALYVEHTAALAVSSVLAEYITDEVKNNGTNYSSSVRELAERIGTVLHDERFDFGVRAERTLEVIYNARTNDASKEISRLLEKFSERYSESGKLINEYKRLAGDVVHEIAGFESRSFSERIERLTERSDLLVERVSRAVAESSKLVPERVFGGQRENSSALSENYPAENDRVEHSIENIGEIVLREERSAALVVSSVLAEYITDEVKNDSTNYSSSVRELAERIGTVLHDERFDFGGRAERTLELIYNARTNETSKEISRLLERFSERYSESGKLLNEYKRLAGDLAPETAISERRSFSERIERLTERSDLLVERVSRAVAQRSKLVPERVFGGQRENSSALSESYIIQNDLGEFSAENNGEIVLRDEMSDIRQIMTNTFEVIRGSENSSAEVARSSGRSRDTLREYVRILDGSSLTQFNRTASDRLRYEINSFSTRRQSIAGSLSVRITEKPLLSDFLAERNLAAELFYTDNYIESGAANSTVNYAVPAAARSSGNSEEVSEKLSELRGAVDNIGSELDRIRERETELSREFVTKSEQRVFERELKNDIERDIYLAGKRHGIY